MVAVHHLCIIINMGISRQQGGVIQLIVTGALTFFTAKYYLGYLWFKSGCYEWYLYYGGKNSLAMWLLAVFVLFVGYGFSVRILFEILIKLRGGGEKKDNAENIALRRLKGMFTSFVMLAWPTILAVVYVIWSGKIVNRPQDLTGEIILCWFIRFRRRALP